MNHLLITKQIVQKGSTPRYDRVRTRIVLIGATISKLLGFYN
jgi:hypothetical protein